MTPQQISLTVNGRTHRLEVEPRRLLCDVIRDDLGLIGTHISCELGLCGVCALRVDGETVHSCLMLAVQADGADIETVENLADGDTLHPLQQAFHEHHALQCGFCTPGMLMTLYGLMHDRNDVSDEEIDHAIDGVLCRCTGYHNIRRAARAARDALRDRRTAAPDASGNQGG